MERGKFERGSLKVLVLVFLIIFLNIFLISSYEIIKGDGICQDGFQSGAPPAGYLWESWWDEPGKTNALDNPFTPEIDDCLPPASACCVYENCSALSTGDVEYFCHPSNESLEEELVNVRCWCSNYYTSPYYISVCEGIDSCKGYPIGGGGFYCQSGWDFVCSTMSKPVAPLYDSAMYSYNPFFNFGCSLDSYCFAKATDTMLKKYLNYQGALEGYEEGMIDCSSSCWSSCYDQYGGGEEYYEEIEECSNSCTLLCAEEFVYPEMPSYNIVNLEEKCVPRGDNIIARGGSSYGNVASGFCSTKVASCSEDKRVMYPPNKTFEYPYLYWARYSHPGVIDGEIPNIWDIAASRSECFCPFEYTETNARVDPILFVNEHCSEEGCNESYGNFYSGEHVECVSKFKFDKESCVGASGKVIVDFSLGNKIQNANCYNGVLTYRLSYPGEPAILVWAYLVGETTDLDGKRWDIYVQNDGSFVVADNGYTYSLLIKSYENGTIGPEVPFLHWDRTSNFKSLGTYCTTSFLLDEYDMGRNISCVAENIHFGEAVVEREMQYNAGTYSTLGVFVDPCLNDSMCGESLGCCNGMCINISSDKENCGSCGNVCSETQECCNGKCANFLTDKFNCGSCGNICEGSERCCNGTCVNIFNDTSNCGSCGNVCEESGTCCNGKCVNLLNDRFNCGSCGNRVWAGECCNGISTAILFDNNNCGSCENVCSSDKGCYYGECILEDCNGEWYNPVYDKCTVGCGVISRFFENCEFCGGEPKVISSFLFSSKDYLCCDDKWVSNGVPNCGSCGVTCSGKYKSCWSFFGPPSCVNWYGLYKFFFGVYRAYYPLEIYLISPSNFFQSEPGPMDFSFTFIGGENYKDVRGTCDLLIDGAVVDTIPISDFTSTYFFEDVFVSSGEHSWFVGCNTDFSVRRLWYNSSSKEFYPSEGYVSLSRSFIKDMLGSSEFYFLDSYVRKIFSGVPIVFREATMNVTFSEEDSFSFPTVPFYVESEYEISNCSLFVDGELEYTTSEYISNESVNYIFLNSVSGSHSVFVACVDVYGNFGISQEKEFEFNVIGNSIKGISQEFDLRDSDSNLSLIEGPVFPGIYSAKLVVKEPLVQIVDLDLNLVSDINLSDSSFRVFDKALILEFSPDNSAINIKSVYVPRESNDNAILFCPSIESEYDLSPDCENASILFSGTEGVSVSEDGEYFVVPASNSGGFLSFGVQGGSFKTTPLENQSRLENSGEYPFGYYLQMYVEYYNGDSWDFVSTVVNDSQTNNLRILDVGEVVGLDTIWNPTGEWNTSYGFGDGTYRVVADLVDNEGNVLYDGSNSNFLTTSFEFYLDSLSPVLILSNYTGYANEPVSLQLSASDENGISSWWIDDYSVFEISSSGLITNSTEVVPGTYSLNVFVNDSHGNIANGVVTITILEVCVPNVVNSTPSDWSNLTCILDKMNQSQYWVEYDENFCNEVENKTHWNYQLVGPNYANNSWSEWDSGICVGNDLNKNRSLISSDVYGCGEEITYYEYNLSVADLKYTDWTDWENVGECLPTDEQNQSRERIQYDGNNLGCFTNVTEVEYKTIFCDFCTPSMKNTSWSDWVDVGCLNNDLNQSKFLIEYDENFCNEVENITHFEYKLLPPNYTNTSWGDWYSVSECRVNDTILQEQNLTSFDVQSCAANLTYFNYQEIECDYCSYSVVNSTSWSEWENLGCVGNKMNQSRFKTEYDENYETCYAVTGLPSDLWNNGNNNTYYEYQSVSHPSCSSGGGGGGGPSKPPEKNETEPTCENVCEVGAVKKSCFDSKTVLEKKCVLDINGCSVWDSGIEIACPSLTSCSSGNCIQIDCDPFWECASWGECLGGNQSRICRNTVCELPERSEYRECEVCKENWKCSYTICSEGDEYSHPYDCEDLNICGTFEKMPGKKECSIAKEHIPDEDIPRLKGADPSCIPSFVCEEWGECDASYSVQNLLEGANSVNGIKKRVCSDSLACVSDRVESMPCELKIEIQTKKEIWCNENYTEIYNSKSNELLTRVKEEKNVFSLPSVDITFLEGSFSGYCGYCYDGVKNYDEEGIDCGGPSCPECVPESSHFDWARVVSKYSWILLLVLVLFIIITNFSDVMDLFISVYNNISKTEKRAVTNTDSFAYDNNWA